LQVEFLLCYAAAGSFVQFCALKRGDREQVHLLGGHCHLKTYRGVLTLVRRTLLVSSIACLQRQQLGHTFLPLGTTLNRPNGTRVTFYDGYVTKAVDLSLLAMDDEHIHDLQLLYNATQHSPYVVHARTAPHKREIRRRRAPQYVVELHPLGVALTAAPSEPAERRAASRYLLPAAMAAP
jgi:hypothetical protein